MISVSTIRSYMFCPLKLYFESNIDEPAEENYFLSKTLKELIIDVQDLFHKNLRHVKKDMDENEVEKRLARGINSQIKITFEVIEEMMESKRKKRTEENEKKSSNPNNNEKEAINKMSIQAKKNLKAADEIEFIDVGKRKILSDESKSDKNENIEEILKENTKTDNFEEEMEKIKVQKKELVNEINLNLKVLSLKVTQAMRALDKNGDEIQGLFFPSCMYNYLIRDLGLDMIGVIDKIEVENGNYFPISLKSSSPPIKGVWDGDLMEVIANGLLIEQEFNTYTTVGYVDYLKIGERRPVIIDTEARKGFFRVLTHINKIIEEGEIPNVKTSMKKCNSCEYRELCENS